MFFHLLLRDSLLFPNLLLALFIELEKLIDGLELPKSGEGLTRPGRFD